jgi:hypothetical protein
VYVAAVTLRVGDRVVHAGDEIPEAFEWAASTLAVSLRAGTIVFVPPQLLCDGGRHNRSRK